MNNNHNKFSHITYAININCRSIGKIFYKYSRSNRFTLIGKGNKRLINWGVSKSELYQAHNISNISVKSNITGIINNDQEEKFT